jgi:hypothetical protein
MAKNKPLMNLNGAMDLIKMSKNPLTPIYEAITNSLEALAQKGTTNSLHEIEVILYFGGLLDNQKELQQVDIIDNGAGFTEENWSRFKEFFDKSKGYDNRGTGRLQYFHRFEHVKVDSVFENEGQYYRRVFSCNKSNFINDDNFENPKPVDLNTNSYHTKVSLCNYLGEGIEKEFFDELNIEQFVGFIKSHFLLRFYLDNKKDHLQAPNVKITFIKAGDIIGEQSISPENMPSPQQEGEISVHYMKISYPELKSDGLETLSRKEVIKWAHFVVPDSELSKNGIYLCSKDIPVEQLNFDQLKKNEQLDGKRYLTAFYGEVFDNPKNVSDSVDCFKLPEKKNIEKISDDMFFNADEEFLFIDSIQDEINKALPNIYKDVIDVQKELQADLESIAKAHGISNEVVRKTKININDDEKTITKKLYSAQSSILAEKSFKAKRLFESLKELNPTDENYQDLLQKKSTELSTLVDEQNKDELSRYVIRREMVTEVLNKIINEELDYQKAPRIKGENRDREGLVHDLIFKRKSITTTSLNDLWVLNEEFLHFEGCSDQQINQIKTPQGINLFKDVSSETINSLKLKPARRPDIFLFAAEEKCLIIEFKDPKEDLSDHLHQMTKYCNLIANYGSIKITKFYCYLVGENINPITDLDGDYKETPYGDWIRPNVSIPSMDMNRNTIANAQIEVIKLSSIHARAHRRNLSFSEKLGLPNLLKEREEVRKEK